MEQINMSIITTADGCQYRMIPALHLVTLPEQADYQIYDSTQYLNEPSGQKLQMIMADGRIRGTQNIVSEQTAPCDVTISLQTTSRSRSVYTINPQQQTITGGALGNQTYHYDVLYLDQNHGLHVRNNTGLKLDTTPIGAVQTTPIQQVAQRDVSCAELEAAVKDLNSATKALEKALDGTDFMRINQYNCQVQESREWVAQQYQRTLTRGVSPETLNRVLHDKVEEPDNLRYLQKMIDAPANQLNMTR